MKHARTIVGHLPLATCLSVALAGCGGGPHRSSSGNPISLTAAVAVSVSPSTANLYEGGSQTFAATVVNSANSSVTWSVQEGAAGGSVNATGTYTAPASAGTFHVMATSQADATKSAAAAIVVTAPPTPTISGSAPLTAEEGVPYTYPVTAIDPAGGSVTLALSQAPAGATITSTGSSSAVISWTPTAAESRATAPFQLMATTSEGGHGVFPWTVAVSGTIRGSNVVSYINTASGNAVTTPSPMIGTVSALAPNGSGFTTVAGTQQADGSFSILGIPAGYYWLAFTASGGYPNYYWTNSSAVDLGYDTYGHAPTVANPYVPLTINVSGAAPYDASTIVRGTSSELQHSQDLTPPAGSVTLGATSFGYASGWFGAVPDAAQGDQTYLYEMQDQSASIGGKQTTIVAAAAPQAITISPTASSFTVHAAMQPVTQTSSIDVTTSGFTAAASGFNPSATSQNIGVAIGTGQQLPNEATTLLLANPFRWTSILQDGQFAFTYPDPFPTAWGQTLIVVASDVATVQLPNVGSMLVSDEAANWYPYDPTAGAVSVSPMVYAASNPRINGVSFFQAQTGVGTTPTFTWSAPNGGSAHYQLLILKTSQTQPVAAFYTTQTSIRIPPGLLSATSNASYFAILTAKNGTSFNPLTAPNRIQVPSGSASVWSGGFTP